MENSKVCIKLYYREDCETSIKAIKWFERYDISVRAISINQISFVELVQLLKLTDNGLEDIVKGSYKCALRTREKLSRLNAMKFNEALNYLKSNTFLFKTPIIIEGNKLLVGYNSEEIRQFLPREKRNKK